MIVKKVKTMAFHSSANKFIFTEKIYNKGALFFGSSEDLVNLYSGRCVEDVTIGDLKTLYFDSACVFPRNKITNFTDIKRCLKLSKANYAVVDLPEARQTWRKMYLFKDGDCFYMIDEYAFNSDSLKAYVRGSNVNKSFITPAELLNYLIKENIISSDSKFITACKPLELSEKQYKSYNDLILGSTIKFITGSTLTKLISSNLMEAENEDLDSIKEMIESSDLTTVGLGLNLLINYNVLPKTCSIGLMLLKNKYNILRSPVLNSVGFKNLLSTLNLSKDDFYRFNERTKIFYIKKLYEASADEEDKAKARDVSIEIIHDQLNEIKKSYADLMNELNISCEINIK